MGIIPFLCLGLLAFETEGSPPSAPPHEFQAAETEPLPEPKVSSRRCFDVPQVEWLWPRVTPRFLHDFPRSSMLLEQTFALRFATCECQTPSDPEKPPRYAWTSVRVLFSSGSEWRNLPQDGFGFLHTSLWALFFDQYIEDMTHYKEGTFLGHTSHAVTYGRAGIRFVHFGINSNWQSLIFPRWTEEDFYGIGPYMGCQTTYSLDHGQLQLFHDCEFSTVFGGVRQKDEAGIPLGSGVMSAYSETGVRSRFVVGFRASGGLHWYEDIGRYRVRFTLGYHGEAFGHVGDELDSLTVHYRNGVAIYTEEKRKTMTDLLSHGPFVQCEIRY
jgi:hypothetical protein